MSRSHTLVAALSLAAASWHCAAPPRSTPAIGPAMHNAITSEGIASLVAEHPCPPDQSASNLTIAATEHQSIHLVQLRKREARHVHATRDLTVFVTQGRGAVMIQDAASGRDRHFSATVGDVFHIPRGTPHYAIPDPNVPLIGIGIFSPPYDGKDNVPAPEP